jgi:dTDP-4-amino-4,6-dideoxygalactose transaminase
MKIPFFDFHQAPETLREEWRGAISKVIEDGRFIGGPEVESFERNWANFLGTKYAVGVANGLDAIILGLKALDIGPESFVAVPSHTFIATWLAVQAVGATPVGIDCDSAGLMNLSALESSEYSFNAVIPVHMHGQMVDMPRLVKWARPRSIKIIEDCAQAHGAKIDGRHAGTWGDVGAFSFYPTKNLGALGDGGALVCEDKVIADKARSLGNYGSKMGNKYKYERSGGNSRLDPIQAAVLNVNLKYLNEWNDRRRQIASLYIEGLKDTRVKMLTTSPDQSVWHHFILLAEQRDLARVELEQLGVFCEIHYPQSAEDSFSDISDHLSSIPLQARNLASKTLSLPLSPWMSHEQVSYALSCITSPKVLRSLLGEM